MKGAPSFQLIWPDGRTGHVAYARQCNIYNMPIYRKSRHVGRDCRHPEHMDVLIKCVLSGCWICYVKKISAAKW